MDSIDAKNREYWMKIRHPFSCGIELTPYCNMKCVHCYMQDYDPVPLLSFDDVKKMLDILYDEGLLFIYFTGGEIFTHPSFSEIFLYAKKKGFIVELLTNITLLTPEMVDIFSEYPPATISISIYGASEETYSLVTQTKGNFAHAIKALRMLKEAELNFEIKFIGIKQNIDDFFAVEAIAKDFNVKFTHTFELFPTLNQNDALMDCMLSVDDIIEFESNYEPTVRRWANQSVAAGPTDNTCLYSCDIARSNFIIDCEGYVNPCNKLRTKEYKILETPFKEIWSQFAKYKKIKAPEEYPCLSCAYKVLCVPCPAENYLSTNSYSIPPKHVCLLSEKRFKEFSSSAYNSYRK